MVVAALRGYAEAKMTYDADPEHAAPELRSRILLMAAASVERPDD